VINRKKAVNRTLRGLAHGHGEALRITSTSIKPCCALSKYFVRAQPVVSSGSRQIGPGLFAEEMSGVARFRMACRNVDRALKFHFFNDEQGLTRYLDLFFKIHG
jgi:hypothetical protein